MDRSSSPHPDLDPIIREALAGYPVLEHDPAHGLPLQVPAFGTEEVTEAVEALLSTYVTMGDRVSRFEAAWARACGCEQAVMANSGSSANLLAWTALVEAGILERGDEVILPAVGWSTTLFPVVQAGLKAVLVDVEPDTLCLDPQAARRAIGPRTRAVCVVHLLGCPARMDAVEALGLPVMEDACAAHGARFQDRPVGALGTVGTFSFFFSHHITTVEGGALVTSDPAVADFARSLRAHGWIREMHDPDRWIHAHPEIDPRFLFATPGYNLRPTEMAAAFGLHQVDRLPRFVEIRRENHRQWCEALTASRLPLRVFPEPPYGLHSGFAFPLVLEPEAPYERSRLTAFLESRRIATRPISGGNLARQPAVRGLPGVRVAGPLPVADRVHERGFFVGNSHAFGPAHGDLLLQTLEEFQDEQG